MPFNLTNLKDNPFIRVTPTTDPTIKVSIYFVKDLLGGDGYLQTHSGNAANPKEIIRAIKDMIMIKKCWAKKCTGIDVDITPEQKIVTEYETNLEEGQDNPFLKDAGIAYPKVYPIVQTKNQKN